MMENKYLSFRANAHLLKLLGDELIGDDKLAVFELVKNSYDADAESVDVTLDLQSPEPSLVVWDKGGDGMDLEAIETKWMEIGTSSKRAENRVRTAKGRMPLGEKGVGRLAVHKIGNTLTINTRAKGHKEIKLFIDWPSLINDSSYIQDTKVKITVLNEPEYFSDGYTGTRIGISNLNNKSWGRGEIRKLKRLITSLKSPFDSKTDFSINLSVPGRDKDINDLLEPQDVLARALWTYKFNLDEEGNLSFSYKFNPPHQFGIDSKEIPINTDGCEYLTEKLELIPLTKEDKKLRKKEERSKFLLSPSDLEGIGPIQGELYVFSRHREVLNAQGAYQSIKDYLDEQSGLRVYRDNIRVFNYGEPNDDWLGLNTSRINSPGKKISNNNIIGALNLDLQKSYGLKEKTNREGFDENKFYKIFHHIILSTIEKFHLLHIDNREALDLAIKGGKKTEHRSSFEKNISEIKKSITELGAEKEVTGKILQIEEDYKLMRDVTVSSGMAGMNLAVIFHEVERGIDEINEDINRNVDYTILKRKVSELSIILEGFTPLLKRNVQKNFKASELVKQVFSAAKYRFKHHKIINSCPLTTGEDTDFDIYGPFGLIRATLSNILDNAIHWTALESEIRNDNYKPAVKLISLPDWFEEGPALVLIDNGPGFKLEPDIAVKPFKTTRPGGMGVGLYYANHVMESIGGRLIITSEEDLNLPVNYKGAAVALVFKKGQK